MSVTLSVQELSILNDLCKYHHLHCIVCIVYIPNIDLMSISQPTVQSIFIISSLHYAPFHYTFLYSVKCYLYLFVSVCNIEVHISFFLSVLFRKPSTQEVHQCTDMK